MIFSWRLTVLCVSRSFLFSLSTYTPHTNLENCTWRQKFDECCPCVNERWRLCCHLYICRRRQPNQHQPRVRVPFITGNLIAYHAHMWDISYYFIVHHLQWVIDRSSFLILFNVFQVYFRKIHVANINHIAPNLLFLHRWQTLHFSTETYNTHFDTAKQNPPNIAECLRVPLLQPTEQQHMAASFAHRPVYWIRWYRATTLDTCNFSLFS